MLLVRSTFHSLDVPSPLKKNIKIGEQDESKRLEKYLAILSELPLVNAVTLRRLLSHLHFIHEESEHNLMPVENLAAIWGPTLMHVEVSVL